jgi:hypothetical protein
MKALVEAYSDRILGFTTFGVGAGEIIATVQIAMLAGLPYMALRDAVLTIRELLDQLPHCGLLFAGTHELEKIFTHQAWSWSSGVLGFMGAKRCRESLKRKPSLSCTLSWDRNCRSGNFKN